MTKEQVKLHHHRFAYELSDGTTGEVTVQNRSLIAWDETRGIRKWPDAKEAPTLWQTFLCWHALTRAGEYDGKFDQFKDECEALDMLNLKGQPVTTTELQRVLGDDDGDESDPGTRAEDVLPEVDPTQLKAVSD